MEKTREPISKLAGALFKAHPWHGVPIGDEQPDYVNVYIEMVPSDTVKYELDKYSGLLIIDRPQAYSNICPAMYGMVPQTLCADRVAEFCMQQTGRSDIIGDEDPLDICVLSERHIPHGNVLLSARPIGGLRMIDHGEADDKIVAVLKGDHVLRQYRDIKDCPEPMLDRLMHYFLTYKQAPNSKGSVSCEITDVYDCDEAHEVIKRSREDYSARFSEIETLFASTTLR